MADNETTQRPRKPGLIKALLWATLHLSAAALISYLYFKVIGIASLFYELNVVEDTGAQAAGIIIFFLYTILFLAFSRYSGWRMQSAKIVVFILCLALGFHVFRYRPPDHFAYIDKHAGEGGAYTAFADPRRGDVPADLNHDVRTAIVVPINNGISRVFEIPASSYFYMGLGIPLETARSGPLHFSVFGEDSLNKPVKIYSRIITANRSQWHDVFVDLDEWAGRTLKMTIQCTVAAVSSPQMTNSSYLIASPRIIERRDASRPAPNIILVVIDTLRYDAADPGTMPTLHRLAQRGVWFNRAYSASSWTGPSTASILTGLMPCQHRVLSYHDIRLPEGADSISEVLQRRGYITAAASANAIISSMTNYNQGFDVFLETPNYFSSCFDSAGRLNRLLINWLEAVPEDAPLFLYVHYMDPHNPYAALPPNGWESPAPPLALPRQGLAWLSPAPWNESMRDEFLNCYLAECRYVDLMLGRLMDRLEKKGFLENSLVFITSDHGEAFLEHGIYMHGADLHEEQVRVPLVMVDSQGGQGQKVYNELISNTDIFPTILDALDLEPSHDLIGKSLYLSIDSPDGERAVFSEIMHWGPKVMREHWMAEEDRMLTIAKGFFRLHHYEDLLGPEQAIFFYNLETDPDEQENLAHTSKTAMDQYFEELQRFFSALPRVEAVSRQPKIDEETRRRLRALGYIKTGG
jgi:arylsulfatase